MWNCAVLDTPSTINHRTYSHTGVIPKASSVATKTLYPVIRFHPNFFPPAKTQDFHPTCTPQTYPRYTPRHSPDPPPSPQSHAIPPGPRSLTVRKPRNINVPISKPGTFSGELCAKMQHLRPLAGRGATPHGGHCAQAATHPDR